MDHRNGLCERDVVIHVLSRCRDWHVRGRVVAVCPQRRGQRGSRRQPSASGPGGVSCPETLRNVVTLVSHHLAYVSPQTLSYPLCFPVLNASAQGLSLQIGAQAPEILGVLGVQGACWSHFWSWSVWSGDARPFRAAASLLDTEAGKCDVVSQRIERETPLASGVGSSRIGSCFLCCE